MNAKREVLAFGCLCVMCGSLCADVRMPAIFGSHMMLQAGTNIPIWGWADPGEAVSVTVGPAKAEAVAGQDGKWKAVFAELKMSATAVVVSVAGKNTLTFEDVLIGDVWICSGQSNMALPLRRVVGRNASDSNGLGQADYPQIRLFKPAKEAYLDPQPDCKGRWSLCTPQDAREFSALGYFFGQEIHLARRIPVGLINSSRGSTNAEYWTSIEGLRSEPSLAKYVSQFQAAKVDYPQRRQQYLQDVAKWKQDSSAAKPARPAGMDPYDDALALPTVYYNGMIAPLLPFAIKGAIWYQGEGNADEAELHKTLFPTMIRDWRKRWDRGDFPFYFVQLSAYRAPHDLPTESNWAALRETQLMTSKNVDNTGMAVTTLVQNNPEFPIGYKCS